jgi:uncharacterized protein YerC
VEPVTARERYLPREQVAVLLHAGATYEQVKETTGACSGIVAATRRAYSIPVPKRHNTRLAPDEREVIVGRVEAMLLDGAPYDHIGQVVGVSPPTVKRIRDALHFPEARPMRPSWTVAEALEVHTQAYGDGHARWTGPMAGRMPQLCAEGRKLNARRAAFEQHHGRSPTSYVRAVCTDTACIAGAHLADAVALRARERAEQP